jgi:hypothetical protein
MLTNRKEPIDRQSLTTIYPFAIFRSEAAQNSTAEARTRHGLLLVEAPEGDGSLEVTRAIKWIGELTEKRDALFICPYMGRAYGILALRGGEMGAVEEKGDVFDLHPEEYDAFINTVMTVAQNFRGPSPATSESTECAVSDR